VVIHQVLGRWQARSCPVRNGKETTMHIDLGQIVTHIIGFIIAVWLLKRYAWQGIMNFIDKRRETIEGSFAEIEEQKALVTEQQTRYEKELENIEALRRAKIQEAARDASKLAAEIREEARRETIRMRDKAKLDIDIELDKANAVLRDRMIKSVLTATEKVIRERLDVEKHNRLIDEFLAEVEVK
jgi:F-type H+-transporting ATPase subunit b